LSLFRIVAFIGSPVEADEKELMRIAKKLKKEKVSLDVVSFGEDQVRNNSPRLRNKTIAFNVSTPKLKI
jgi:hypothetical protein